MTKKRAQELATRSTASVEQLARTARALEASTRKRKFIVGFCVEVEVDQAVFDAVLTDEWRNMFYGDIHTPDDVAGHLAFNLVQGTPITSLDGFADQDEKSASIGPIDIEDVREEIETPKPKPRTRPKKLANDRRSKNR